MDIIQLSGQRYRCRVVSGSRQVEVNGEYMDSGEFVDHLITEGKMNQLNELVKLGQNKVDEIKKRNQETK